MYKLVFIILTLSGFLIYKALNLKVAGKTNLKSKKVFVSGLENTGAAPDKTQTVTSNGRALPPVTRPAAALNEKVDGHSENLSAIPSEGPARREDFDSLREVFQQSEEIEPERMTQQEKDEHNATIKLMQKIEAEAEAKRNGPKGISKRPEDLTPEEQKQFEIYNTFEKKEVSDESKQ